jgi:outer membrane protein OmpA-like peptidoglycan-associated protein
MIPNVSEAEIVESCASGYKQPAQEQLEKQKAALQQQQQQTTEAEAKIAANKAAVEAAHARFGQLGDYNILDEVAVYFANGKVAVDPKYNSQLLQLAEKAKSITAYMIQVQGYASSSGSVALNQKLSEDRANEGYRVPAAASSRAPYQYAGARCDG